MSDFNTGSPQWDEKKRDQISLTELFGEKAEKYNMQVMEEHNTGFSIIGFYNKNLFTLKEDAIKDIEEALNLKSALKGYKYSVSIPYLSQDMNTPFLILVDFVEGSSKMSPDLAYKKYLNDFRVLSHHKFKKEYSSMRYKRLTNTEQPLPKEKFTKIYLSSIRYYAVDRQLPSLNKRLDDLEVVVVKDEDGDICFFIINPEANMQEYLEVLDWLEAKGVELNSYLTDINRSFPAKEVPELVELGYGGGDTAIDIWSWKDAE